MPLLSHSARLASKFIMLVAPRYKTARTLCSCAVANNPGIGDSRVCPAANHVGSSIIQKSGSSCTAMAALSVNAMSLLITENCRFADVKYSATGFVSVSSVSSGADGVAGAVAVFGVAGSGDSS